LTVKTPAELIIDLNNDLPDNTSGLISPADSRLNLVNGVESWDAQKIDNSQDVVNRFNANKIQGQDVAVTVPTDKQLLVFNASSGKWEPGNLLKSLGFIGFVDNSTVTTIAVIDTPVKIDPATFTSFNLIGFVQSVNGRLTYTGTITKSFAILASVNLFAAANDREMTIYIAKNGTIINESKSQNTTKANEASETTAFFITDLSQNDFIELFVENNETTDNITCPHVRFRAIEL